MRDVADTLEREVEVGGIEEVGSFKIEATAAAFKVLVANLYADKPRAICRELCANAFDSHIAAGTPERPFKVTLPTRFEQTFSVRDYGVSLSHEDVMGLYTTLFKSTKADTNTQVGKFGLGSKVPFSYTDSFTVTAIKDGEKRIYNAFIDEKGIPRIARLLTQPSDEETGLEVSFPVRAENIDAFRTAMQDIIYGFDVVPECNLDLKGAERVVIYEADNWKLCQSESHNYRRSLPVFMRQGCVIYPVKTDALEAAIKNDVDEARRDTMIALFRNFDQGYLLIDAPIGTFDITPSREDISYDDNSIRNIYELIGGIAEVVAARALDGIANQPTLYEARKQYLSIASNLFFRLAWKGQRALWKGKRVDRVPPVPHHYSKNVPSTYMERCPSWRSKKGYRISRSGYRMDNLFYTIKNDNSRHFDVPVYYYKPGQRPKDLTARMNTLFTKHPGESSFVVLEDFDPNKRVNAILRIISFRSPKIDNVFADINDVEATEMEKFRNISKAPLRILDVHTFRFEKDKKSIPAAEDDKVYVVDIYQNAPYFERNIGTEDDPQMQEISLDMCGLINSDILPNRNWPIVGVPATWTGKGGEVPPTWTRISDVIADMDMTEVFKNKECSFWHLMKHQKVEFSYHDSRHSLSFMDFMGRVAGIRGAMKTQCPDSAIAAFSAKFEMPKGYIAWRRKLDGVLVATGQSKTYERAFEKLADNVGARSIPEFAEVKENIKKTHHSFKDYVKELWSEYPLLAAYFAGAKSLQDMGGFHRKRTVVVLAEYVDMIDSNKQRQAHDAEDYAWS